MYITTCTCSIVLTIMTSNMTCTVFIAHFYCYISFSGNVAREEMVKSKLPNSVLRRVWALSDIDKDGMLDRDEFAVALFLIDHKLKGNDIPETLPDRVIPPSKRTKSRGRKREESPGSSYRGGTGGGGYTRNHDEDPLHSVPPQRHMGDYDDDSSGLGGYVD